MKTASPITVFALLAALATTTAAAPQVNQRAIDDVKAGRCKIAQAAWWGFDAQESTTALQAAINSGASQVVVAKMSGPWIVDKLTLASNQEIHFEPGVVVLAKKDAFHGKNDALFTASNKSNIKLVGPGATLQMRRADYDSPAYSHAEWRTVLNFHGCTGVLVSGLTLADSGGDGIYLGTGSKGATNKDFVIRDVICDRNYRQGISVITAENLLIENCVLKNTAGTPPAAGIDFEPNHASERLVNCVMRNCLIEDNQGLGLHIYARAFDATTAPMSIRVEKCVMRGSNARSASIITSCGPKGPVRGSVELIDCRFEEPSKAGIAIGSNSPQGVKIRFVNCTLANTAAEPSPTSPIQFSSRQGDEGAIGGVEFVNLIVKEPIERPLMKFHDAAGLLLDDIRGTICVERPGKVVKYTLDRALLDKFMPVDPARLIARVAWSGLKLQPAPGAPAPQLAKLPAHRLREQAVYLLYAEPGQTVAFRLRHQAVGRSAAKSMPVEVFDPAGKRVGKLSVELGQEGEHTFQAKAAGVYRIACKPASHTVQLVSCSHPVSLASEAGTLHFIQTAAEFCFLVPQGARQFAVRVAGEGDRELLKATVRSAAGEVVWEQDQIGASQSYRFDGPSRPHDEIWKIRIARPTKAVFEDHHLELRGIPTIVSFQPEALLRPKR